MTYTLLECALTSRMHDITSCFGGRHAWYYVTVVIYMAFIVIHQPCLHASTGTCICTNTILGCQNILNN